jgi:hypothetical protein
MKITIEVTQPTQQTTTTKSPLEIAQAILIDLCGRGYASGLYPHDFAQQQTIVDTLKYLGVVK